MPPIKSVFLGLAVAGSMCLYLVGLIESLRSERKVTFRRNTASFDRSFNRNVVGERPQELASLVDQAAQRHGLEPELIYAVIRVESNFNPRAVSYRNAQGLMQLIPSTARRYGVRNTFDPAQNIAGGSWYLADLKARYNGDEELALAAYNSGEGNVDRLLLTSSPRSRNFVGIRHRLPYETRSYVPRIMRYRREYSRVNF
ncbi:MAG: lytic transglycosylase, catalytic [Parcubacteria group bacterium Gr01-1014_30]|nr:MAG: lytic transglycosylase, catalytic [Parcubacteria group bacterium Gr01-1014_30]